MGAEATAAAVQRYRAKAARRPVLFWWQGFLLLLVVLALWCQLPMTAVLFEPRVAPPPPEPHAAYVTLDPAYAAQVIKRTMMAWASGGKGAPVSPGLDVDVAELDRPQRAPEFLEQGARYPGVWRPSEVEPLPQRPPALRVPQSAAASGGAVLPPPPSGLCVELAPALRAAGFEFPKPAAPLPGAGGRVRFYLETDAEGAVAHVLLLSPATPAAAQVERALSRGRASRAASGAVELVWREAREAKP